MAEDEGKYPADLSKESEMDELYSTWKGKFFEMAAERLSEKFTDDPNFVRFTPKNVKNRISHSRRAYVVSEVFAPLLPVLCPTTVRFVCQLELKFCMPGVYILWNSGVRSL